MAARKTTLASTRGLALALALTVTGTDALAQRGPAPAQGGGGRGAGGQRGAGPERDPGGRFGGRGFGGGDLPAGTGVIRGRVTAQDTGAPVRRAQVRATTTGAPFGRLATTDADGQFELRDLPEGQWAVTASKPGFVTQRLGQKRPFDSGTTLSLRNGEQLSSANFALTRGGAITGRVTDDFGDPIANARVQVLRSQMVDGRRRLTPVGAGDDTDDTGAFRLYGLAPGDYYVAATLRAAPLDASADRSGYAPTYFPGTGSVGEAQRVSLGVGQELPISFSLLPVRTVRVSGTVVSAAGGPPTGGVVALTSADGDDVGIVAPTGGQIQANGAFTISNAVPGSYLLAVRTGIGRGARGGGEAEVGMLPLVVGSDDISGLTITTTRGASLEGTIVAASGAQPPLDNVRVVARPVRAAAQILSGRSSQATVAPNGSFALSSLVGRVVLRVDGLPSQWMVKSVEVGGADVTDAPLDLKGSEQLTGARITVTDRIAELNGTVSDGNAPAADFAVVVFAEDDERWTFPTRFVRSVRGTAEGTFSVRGLPPDVPYLAIAVSALENGEIQDPEFLRGLRERASSVSIREGETKSLTLRLQERP